MTQKVRKVLIMVVMAALILCLMAASLTYTFTYGRYAGNDFNADDSPYDDLIEFVGSREYTVRTPEELIQAIEDGYSNIQIAVDAEEPFVITEGVTDVSANLVLDLNGKVVVRNSRNPLLDVQTNVSVVLVYDSSKEGQGAFYNPVGSSLQASGGTLTVGSGNYEDGPRAEEYGNVSSAVTLGTQPADVTIYTRNGITDPSSVDRAVQTSYTKIEDPQNLVPATTGRYYQPETSNSAYTLVPADTFLIYTEEENCFIGDDTPLNGVTFVKDQLYVDAEREGDVISASEFISPECNVASCDFYYYYPIDENGSPINTPGTADTPQDYAVIYGYWDVMALAEKEDKSLTSGNDTNLIWPYAAVRMVNGEGFVRGGNFKNNFNAVNTYGIYATDGRLAVSQVPVTSGSITTNFTTGGDGVCIRVSSSAGSTTGGDEGGGTLDISGGSFSSEIGNTIEMQGGTMNVTAGTFTKNAAVEGADSGEGANNGSAIDITGGTLNMTGTEANDVKSVSFDIKGNYVNGIKMEKEESATADPDTIKNAAFSFNKESGQGSGGTSVAAIQVLNGSLNVSDSTFDFNQGYAGTAYTNNGIYVQGGSVNATNCAFSLSPNGSVTGSAAIASAGGKVTAEGCDFEVNGYSNYGVYSLGGEITATDCGFTMTQAGSLSDGRGDNFGIYSTLSENISAGTATANGCTINVTGTYSAGVLSMAGTLNLGASTTKATSITVSFEGNELSSSGVSSEGGEINLTGNTEITSDGLGITARGEVNVTGGTSTVTTARGTGVYVQNGTLNIEQSATVSVESKIDNNCTWVVPPEHQDEDEPLQTNKFNGVFVNGGSLESTGTLKVTFTGVQNDQNQTDDNEKALTGANAYRLFEIKSYAVRVEAGTGTDTKVTIASGNITNTVGGGVLVNGGTVYLGGYVDENGTAHTSQNPVTVQTTGKDVYYTLNGQYINSGIYYAINDQTSATDDNIKNGGNWRYLLPKTGGPAVKVTNGDLSVYDGSYHALQGDGIVINGGTAEIQSGEFLGRDSYYIKNNYRDGNGNWLGASVQTEEISEPQAGPAASYAFKVYNGTANVYGGTFGSSSSIASGAFVMGTSADHQGTAKIYGGSFVVSSGNAGGQAGFSVYEYGNVLVDPRKGGAQQNLGGDVTMTGLAAGLVIEGNTSNTVSVEIKGGEFSSTRNHGNSDGIWYSNSNATLKISGGTFTGYDRSGLWFDVTPQIYDEGRIDGHGSHYSTNVKITGGGFKGNSYAIYAKESGSWNERPSYAIGVNYIIVPESLLRTDEWDSANAPGGTSVGYGEWDPAYWNDALEDTIINCKKIAVGQYYIETWWQQN